jgi:membrane protein DedA with SNARE-associated domain
MIPVFIQHFWTDLSHGAIPPAFGYWSYLLIAVLAFLEGSATTLVAAALAGAGVLNPGLVLVSAGLGNATADATWYWLGRLGRFDMLATHLSWLRKFEPQINRLEQEVKVNGPRLYLITKLGVWPAVIPTLIAAGMARVPWRKILLVSAVSEPIYTGGLVLAGYFLGNYLSRLKLGLEWIWWAGAAVVVFALPLIVKKLTQGTKRS